MHPNAPSTVGTVINRSAGAQIVVAVHPMGRALLPMDVGTPRRLVWVDRTGQETPIGFDFGSAVGGAAAIEVTGVGARLSPDGNRIAVVIGRWPVIVDLDDLAQPRVLGFLGSRTAIAYPRWSPSGEHISVIGNSTGAYHGYRIDTSGGSPPERFTDQPQSIPTSFFPDSESMIGYVVAVETGRDLWVFHPSGPDEPLLATSANERAPVLSPDGRAYAYVSDESGEDRVYLRRYPENDQAWAISDDGASAPLWSRDGREVFFVENGRLMAVSVDLSDRVRHSGASELFAVGAYDADPFGNTVYDVAEDGRFLMTHVATGSRTWRWIQNWGVDLEATLAGEQ